MQGRYGADGLFKFILGVAAALLVLNIFLRTSILSAAVGVLLVWAYFRAFSRNISARQRENHCYMKLFGKVTSGFRIAKLRFRDRKTHCYRKCPVCKKLLRLPKRKGTHTVNCPQCKNDFTVKI